MLKSIRKYKYISSTELTMAEEEEVPTPIEDEEPEETPGYKPPAQKTLQEIQTLDADDESLVRYKQMLLAGAGASGIPRESDHYIFQYWVVIFLILI